MNPAVSAQVSYLAGITAFKYVHKIWKLISQSQLRQNLLVVNIWARGHKMTPGQTLIELWVISSIQLVDGELPDRVRTGWAVQGIAVTLVGHSKY